VTPPALRPTPGLSRRLASMLYELLLLFAVGFVATWTFFFVSGGSGASGFGRTLLQAFVLAVFAAYFLWCWLRGGQTLPMKAWRIRLEQADGRPVSPGTALLRFALAAILVPSLVGIVWALVDRDRQFLHDRLARTRLVLWLPGAET
jgi:uncharacterized RDD family membrane protein YckC